MGRAKRQQSDPLPIDLARLPKMPLSELREIWRKHDWWGPPPQRRLLIREIAWRIQEQRLGGFDATTQRLLNAVVRSVMSGDAKPKSSRPKGKPRTSPKLPAAARIVREWRGQRHEIIAVDHGRAYQHAGRTYRSLTEVAKAITGTHQSGPRFFGITTRAKAPPRPDAPAAKGGAR